MAVAIFLGGLLLGAAVIIGLIFYVVRRDYE